MISDWFDYEDCISWHRNNLGNRESNLEQAVARIEEYIGTVLISSSVYETEPWGFQSKDEFLNLVVKVETESDPFRIIWEEF